MKTTTKIKRCLSKPLKWLLGQKDTTAIGQSGQFMMRLFGLSLAGLTGVGAIANLGVIPGTAADLNSASLLGSIAVANLAIVKVAGLPSFPTGVGGTRKTQRFSKRLTGGSRCAPPQL